MKRAFPAAMGIASGNIGMIWEMQALHTHLYPGARLLHRRTDALEATGAELQAGDEVLIEFADLSMTCADVMAVEEDQILLRVDGYRTRHGTRIANKSWVIQRDNAPSAPSGYRVIARA
jgi:hypothetical protein